MVLICSLNKVVSVFFQLKSDQNFEHYRADNYAQSRYRNILGAQVEATIANLYSADEVVMVARNFDMAEALN